MKLRNKKTGEHGDYQIISAGNLIRVREYESDESWQYDSLARFNEKWEDYAPSEPLIKDEKIRKAVRAWAEANGYSLVKIGYDMASEPNDGYVQIHFEASIVDEDKFGVHTITELCGEDEG